MNASHSSRSALALLKTTLEVAVGLLVLGVVFCVAANVFGRFVLNYSYAWAEELSRVLFIWLVLLGAGLGSIDREHVAVTYFQDKAPAPLRKLFALLCIAVIYIVCVCILFGFRDQLSGFTSATPMLQIPRSVLYSAMPVMAVLTLIANTLALVKLLRGTAS
ncbi:TRAP transporter small permease [Modicisalibacter tunisiensis]|uniref:TRAP transporter small permease protein n=1 Tax=Modicisalibacter tunisiensis TaxID=390637 RepID=A0ABS7X4V2_9GAMM|nr:TRAP transporter small permease [Modicisalibacter tunisiensis]MBZ9537602.1 TRAP transporter small permease [Modicisalibacter tunisiensis]MBZ9568976.1 TRAP transporter small permease [Modicisalibacter tunisiensis]